VDGLNYTANRTGVQKQVGAWLDYTPHLPGMFAG